MDLLLFPFPISSDLSLISFDKSELLSYDGYTTGRTSKRSCSTKSADSHIPKQGKNQEWENTIHAHSQIQKDCLRFRKQGPEPNDEESLKDHSCPFYNTWLYTSIVYVTYDCCFHTLSVCLRHSVLVCSFVSHAPTSNVRDTTFHNGHQVRLSPAFLQFRPNNYWTIGPKD